ncbi:MAG: hypothetical protein ACREMN_11275 [Gemmatimonadales bacterium]
MPVAPATPPPWFGPAEATTAASLAAVLLLEGIRRVPEGAVVLQRFIFGAWRSLPRTERRGVRLLSWWSPLMLSIVVRPRRPEGGPNGGWDFSRAHGQFVSLRPLLYALQALGLALLLAMVFGIPAATGRFGTPGFFIALGAVFALCLGIVALAAWTAAIAGRPPSAGLPWSLRFLSPFAAPRAAELLLEELFRDLPPALTARVLLGPEAFVAWIRPHVYDRLHGRPETAPLLLDGLDVAEWIEPVSRVTAPDPGAALWCPRCGARFIHAALCADCGIPLLPVTATTATGG